MVAVYFMTVFKGVLMPFEVLMYIPQLQSNIEHNSNAFKLLNLSPLVCEQKFNNNLEKGKLQ